MWVLLGLLVYAFLAGLIGRWFYRYCIRGCKRNHNNGCMHEIPACFAGAGWPCLLPLLAGSLTADWFTDGHDKRRTTKHQRQMEKLAAENDGKKLAIEQARLNIEFLKANGVNTGPSDLFEAR